MPAARTRTLIAVFYLVWPLRPLNKELTNIWNLQVKGFPKLLIFPFHPKQRYENLMFNEKVRKFDILS